MPLVLGSKNNSNDSSSSSSSGKHVLGKKKEEVRFIGPVLPTRIETGHKPINGPLEMNEAQPMDINDRLSAKARKIPVLGSILRGLDAFSTNKYVDKGAEIARSFYVPGSGIANIAGLTQAAEAGVAKALPSLGNSVLGRIGQKALSEGLVGAPLGLAQEQMVNSDASTNDLLQGASYGFGGGAVLGGLGKSVGEALRYGRGTAESLTSNSLANAYRDTNTLSLPLGRGESRLTAALDRSNVPYGSDPIVNPYTFGLPQASEATISHKNNLDDAFNSMRGIDDELTSLDSRYQQAINDQYQLLKQQRNERGGVQQGQLIQDEYGNVKGRVGRISNNPQWYQEFYKEHGKVPSNKDLYKLAQKHVDEGYMDNGTEIPSWLKENDYHGTKESLGSVREEIRNSIKEKGINLTDAQLKDQRLKGINKPPKSEIAPLKQEMTLSNPVIQQSENVPNVRSNYRNLQENGNFSDELNTRLSQTDQSYEPITNADTVAKSNENIKNLTATEAKFHGNSSLNAEHITDGYRLIQTLDQMGEHQRALNVANKLATDLTKAGQTVQAASVLARLSPEGQLLNLVKTAERNGKTVDVADKVAFQKAAEKLQENSGAGVRENQINDILTRIEKGEAVTPEDMKKVTDLLSRANKVVKPKVKDIVQKELNEPRKREKVVKFLDDAEQAALARIAARKNRLNALPFDEWADHAIVVASQLAKGTIKAATYTEDMVKLFGEEIRPVATKVFQQAQKMVQGVSKNAAEDNLEKAQQVLRKLSGEAEAEKAIVEETAAHVKKLIADAKAGKLTPEGVQKLRDYSDEIVDMLKDKKPSKVPTAEEKFLQSVKQLAKKIKEVETEKIEPEQANKDISNLIRQVTEITEGKPVKVKTDPALNKALSDIAHDVMNETRPTPKPTTLQEKIVDKYIKKNPNVSEEDVKTLRELATNVSKLEGKNKIDADIAMQKILNSYEKSSVWDKTLAIRYMSMLLNSGTQAVNAISGPIMATTGTVSDIFGTMIDIAMNKTLKTPRTTTLYGTNPLKFLAGWFQNAKVGGKAGFEGVNPAGIQSTNEIRGLAFKSKLNPLGLAERTLGAVAKGADYGTYKSVYDSEIVRQGFLDAKNKGIKGNANIEEHIKQFVNNPTEEAILQADRIGKNTTFQRSDTTGGKMANWLNNSPNIGKPLVTSIFPFVRTPVNIASTAVTLTPGGIIKGLYQLIGKSEASQREAIRNLSLGITGTGIGALGYYLSDIGIITGANDSGDKDVDAVREQAGKGKYRFNTSALMRYLEAMMNGKGADAAEQAAKYQKGDKQFDYNKLQPLAFPLAIGAGANDNKDATTGNQILTTGEGAAASLLGMSSLKGLQDTFQPQYGGTQGEKTTGIGYRLAESFFKSFSPSALAQEARRQDPIQRKVSYNNGPLQDTKEYFQSRIPGLSQSLPANKTTLGQNKLNVDGVMGQYANPYKSDVAPYNDAAKIITELMDRTGDFSIAPSAPDKKVTGKDKATKKQVSISIPKDRYAQLQEDVGNEIIKKITALDPSLSDDKKIVQIKKIYSDVETKARNKVKKELGIIVN